MRYAAGLLATALGFAPVFVSADDAINAAHAREGLSELVGSLKVQSAAMPPVAGYTAEGAPPPVTWTTRQAHDEFYSGGFAQSEAGFMGRWRLIGHVQIDSDPIVVATGVEDKDGAKLPLNTFVDDELLFAPHGVSGTWIYLQAGGRAAVACGSVDEGGWHAGQFGREKPQGVEMAKCWVDRSYSLDVATFAWYSCRVTPADALICRVEDSRHLIMGGKTFRFVKYARSTSR